MILIRNVSGKVARRSWHSSSRRERPEKTMNVFDRNAKLLQRERAAQVDDDKYDFLKEEIGYRLSDRVLDIKRQMNTCIDLGSGKGYVTRHLTGHSIKRLVATEMSPLTLEKCQLPPEEENVQCEKVLLDEDTDSLPFDSESADIVTSSLSLHWVNNLPGLFREVNRVLKKDGVFIGAMFGGETLFELRCSLQMADLERNGGIGQHISPFVEVQDLGNLLNRCGFTMLTIDSDELKVGYASVLRLLEDLKGMSESNAAWARKLNLGKDVLLSASSIYHYMYQIECDVNSIPATFQIFYWIGWKPGPNQPKPLSPQKSDISLKDLPNLENAIERKND